MKLVNGTGLNHSSENQNNIMLCPECGKTYMLDGKRLGVDEPEWSRSKISSRENRIIDLKQDIASYICDTDADMEFIDGYVDFLSRKESLSDHERRELMRYAKLGILIKRG